MARSSLDPEKCRNLWAAVFERALRDAKTHIPSPPNHYWYSLYLQQEQRRKRRSKILSYRKWAQVRRGTIKKLERRRDDALKWMDSEDFGVCCDLLEVNAEALRLRLLGMAGAGCNA